MTKKRYEELSFTDDFMFCKVLANNEELCKELLELILDIQIRKVKVLNRQEVISITADAKGVRLDVYVEDDDNTVFDVDYSDFLVIPINISTNASVNHSGHIYRNNSFNSLVKVE